ncbi:DUF3817 domain-containing protein [Zhouia spongiae]|uniref:DUF3817 domain-containing protein n=1 Tax=Zhouia spongiae TaxID=2202721 RepID=A0ABY3YKA0_9FLAO|nr:DUF3817 domain-containing protein [Zhouia spongiae]UNY98072.1 DUF3817 domain-containing protein [Zhouia spongiae]
MNIKNFRIISILEGISYLVILGITMPLKYMADQHGPNQYVGMMHGILFILYVLMAVALKNRQNWSAPTLGIILLCSIIPFGTFWMDRKYLRA